MSAKALVARIGQVATSGKHKDRFLYVGTIEPKDSLEKFFYLIEIDSPWVNGEKIKNAIINTLGENYQPVSSKDKVDALEEIIKKINLDLGNLGQSGEHEWIGKINAIVGLASGKELVFSQTGSISGYLFRGNKISHITEKPLESDDVHPLKTFLSIINGNVANKDRVIIGNRQLYTHLSLDRLRQILSTFQYKDAITEIVRILRKTKTKDANLIIFDFLNEDEASAEIDEKPEIILLDDVPDSRFIHYSKVFFRGVGSGAKAAGSGLQKTGQFWIKNIQPKISQRAKSVGNRARGLGTEAFKPVSEKFDGAPRVNYFKSNDNSKNKASSAIKRFLQNLLFWSKQLLRPENRKYLYIILAVILLSIGFVKIAINNQKNSGLGNQSASLASLESARDLYTKALDDIGLKKSGGKDKLIEAKGLATKALESPSIHDEAKNLLNQIQAKLDELNTAIRVDANKEASFSLSGNKIKIFAVGADIYSYDADGNIGKYDTRKKNFSHVTSVNKDKGIIKNLSFSDSQNSFFILTDKSKLEKLDLADNTVSEVLVVDANGNWEDAVAIATFSTNIYLLDANAGEIWKHSKNDTGYSKGSSYLVKPTISIKEAVNLAIDGDIYVLKADGAVVKVKKAVEDASFNIATPPTPDDKISSPAKIFSSPDSASIYILDKAANRIVEFSKTGAYKKQYVADKELPLTDFAVNTKMKKLWLLSESKVFELDI